MEKTRFLILFILFYAFGLCLHAQNISITNDGSAPSANAILDVKSTTKGVKIPRMTSEQRNEIATSASDAGLLVFDLDKGTLYMFDGISWLPLAFLSNAFPAITGYPNDREEDSNFGCSVAIDGDYAIIGAYLNDIGIYEDAGAAYIFHRVGSSWKQQARLTADDSSWADYFGFSVAISGDYVIVGAYNDDFGTVQYPIVAQGSAYIFHHTTGSTWEQQAKLTALNGDENDWFGYSVSISGEFAAIGAPYANTGFNGALGEVYMYRRSGNNWPYQNDIEEDDVHAGDLFGWSVSLYGENLIVGAPGEDNSPGSPYDWIGAVYFYYHSSDPNSWSLTVKHNASDATSDDRFGTSVCMYENYAVVGAPYDDVAGESDRGSAYVFFLNPTFTWHEIDKITATGGNANDHFGASVAIHDPYIIVGADLDNIGSNADQGPAMYLNAMVLNGTLSAGSPRNLRERATSLAGL
ncbi:MAG TPA: FG-GAP repeat protein [Saprospiraceae bacterium]|nr:FG-GAP repeat protein [Saprospiraceae bacterium]